MYIANIRTLQIYESTYLFANLRTILLMYYVLFSKSMYYFANLRTSLQI